jgi:L-iditol 2-dehydrogenase
MGGVTMKAVMKVATGEGNVEVRELEEPVVPPGHAKLEVRKAGICGTDLHIYHDEFRTRPPVVMGHEVSGEVVELGDGVSRVAVGDRVTTETYFSTCGMCRFCRSGRPNLCSQRLSIGSAVHGGFTRYLVVPEHNLHRLPESVGFVEGALTEPLACVVHGVLEMTSPAPDDLAVVAGPGAIGLLTLQVLKAAGCRVVVLGTDGDEWRLTLAGELGADHVVNVEREDAVELVRDLSWGDGAEAVYECSGAGPAAQQMLVLVRKQGHYAQIGLFGKPVSWDLDQVCYKELTVTGSNASVPSAWDKAVRLLAEGKVRTGPLVTGVFPITEWRRAFDIFEGREGVKTVLHPDA